ncbi:MAG: ROK family transcriptional regulator, partial [Peptococcaceae bacterium]|nr:ROK family transcriptional regulator [Peptococcaceae bacterium]
MQDARNLESVKKLNRINVLNIVRENENISRQQLAELTRLTPAAITGIVRELVELGYVQEIGLGESSGGRRPMRLQICPDAGYVIGAEITRNRTTIGIVDLLLRPVKVLEAEIDMENPKTAIDSVVEKIEELIAETEIPVKKIHGAGFAFPGLLDITTKVIKRSPSLGEQWCNIPVKQWLEARLNLPLHVEHNPHAAALAEYTIGKGKDIKNLVYVNLGEGFSAGVIMDNKMLYGAHGHAGEMGHMVVVEDGPLCNCGNKGCLESIYAVSALVRKANNELPLCQDNDGLKAIWQQKGKI